MVTENNNSKNLGGNAFYEYESKFYFVLLTIYLSVTVTTFHAKLSFNWEKEYFQNCQLFKILSKELWFNEEFCNTCTSTVKNNLSKCNKHNKEKDVGNRYTLSLFQSQRFFTITVYKSQEDWSLEDVVKQKKQKGCILKSKTTTITLWI